MELEHKIGRRSFLKMSGITVAVVAGGGLLAACGSSPTATSSSVTSSTPAAVSPTTSTSTTSTSTTSAATSSGTSATPAGSPMTGMPAGGMMGGGGAVDKSSDTQLQAMISAVESKFKQFQYTD